MATKETALGAPAALADFTDLELLELRRLLADRQRTAPLPLGALQLRDGTWLLGRIQALASDQQTFPRGLPWVEGKPLLDPAEREKYFAAVDKENARPWLERWNEEGKRRRESILEIQKLDRENAEQARRLSRSV